MSDRPPGKFIMAVGNGITPALESVSKRWNLLVQASAWIFSLIAGFLLPPPVGSGQGESGSLFRFSQFVLTVFVGLMAIPIYNWNKKKHTLWWWGVALTSLVGGIIFYFVYQSLTDRWTDFYARKQWVVGSELTEDGEIYREDHPKATNAEMLQDLPGGPDQIWTKASIDRRRRILEVLYILCVPLFTTCILATTQAIYCSASPPSRSAKPVRGPRRRAT